MSPKHTNTRRPNRRARAPYNFVPLPENMVPAREPLDQDVYHKDALTGWIECELETCSPTYVRGMLTPDKHKELGEKKPDELTPEEKEQSAPFFATTGELIEGFPKPVIPGSSLRGMIRTLVEIVGYGRMRWVAAEPTFTFRAVAAAKADPLRDPYQEALGANGKSVQAGYLARKGEQWYVWPALTPKDMGWRERSAYLKVKEWVVKEGLIPDYVDLNDEDYHPQLHDVSFDIEPGQGQRGPYTWISRVGPTDAGYAHQGVLVCSGNMLETAREDPESLHRRPESPRKNLALVLLPAQKAKPLAIQPQAVADYLAGMTPFQRDELGAWDSAQWGCLNQGVPVFYVTEGDTVAYFGHSPNFRIPARLFGKKRAATPLDFVPNKLKTDPRPDLADAIFGWVEEEGVALAGQRAGRVFFEDARFEGAKGQIWYKPEPITPHTLSGPKPTTFQHYLAQDRNRGHNPDDRKTLAHYGTSPEETEIRGHKLYWHKGEAPDIEATDKERKHEKQLTRLVPLNPGVKFSFRIHFENLRPEELGALWWALALPGDAGETYRHKLGMGKPLGMGAMALTPQLVLTKRRDGRYDQLFDGDAWEQGADDADADQYLKAFHDFVLKEAGIAPDKEHLAQVERIRHLLAVLQWHETSAQWLEDTRYMEIEREPGKVNEYTERPVLPDPLQVVSGQRVRPPLHQRDRR